MLAADSVLVRRWVSVSLAGSLVLLGAFQSLSQVLNHDAAWHLYAGGLIRQGQYLYRDILEFNPPMIYWFSVLPHWLAESTVLSPIAAFKMLVLILVLAAAGSGWAIAHCQRAENSRFPEYSLLLFLFAGLTLTWHDFGQREHLFWIATWPYLMIVLGRAEGRTAPIGLLLAAGALAGFGFALKPQFLIVPAALEATLWWSRRTWPWREPETVAWLSVVLVYWLVVSWQFPQYFEMLRLASTAYREFEADPLRVLEQFAKLPLAALMTILLFRPDSNWRLRWRLMGVAFASFLILALVPLKGWTYHFYPARAMALVVIGSALVVPGRLVIGRLNWPRTQAVVARLTLAVILLAAVVGSLLVVWYNQTSWPASQTAQIIQVVQERADDGAIWIMDSSMRPAFPVVNYAGVAWGSRLPFLWLLESAEPRSAQPSTEKAREARQLLFDIVTTDLQQRKPRLVLVKAADIAGFEESDFNLIHFFSRDPRFARLWNRYRLIGIRDYFQIYELVPNGG